MERIAHLSEQLGDRGEFFRALLNLCDSCFVSGELSKAGELAQRALTLAGDAPPAVALAHRSIGLVLQRQGEFARSQKELEKALALAETTSPLIRETASPLISFGNRARFLTLLADTLWPLGYPGQAFDRAEQARALAKNEPDLWMRSLCEAYALNVRLWGRDPHLVGDATRFLTFATENGFSAQIYLARIYLGGALVRHGQTAQGLAVIELGLKERARMKGPWWNSSRHDVMLADAYAKVGRFSDGLRLVATALARSEQTGEAMHRAEFYRLKGELLLAGKNTNVDEAQRAFRTAIGVADQQAARSWELRATVSLARLLRSTNRHDEARAMLAEIYSWFTEGFDTADLKEAKALLDELSG
jgi:tetratricopeptide (TPR) repeat protein